MTAEQVLISISLALNIATGASLYFYMRDVDTFNKKQMEINDTTARIIKRIHELLK